MEEGSNENAPVLTPEQQNLKKLFYLSFRYSQGDEALQYNLFSWLIEHKQVETNLLSGELPNYLAGIRTPSKNHVETVLGEELNRMWDGFCQRVTSEKNPHLESSIADKIIERDLLFSEEGHDRQGRINDSTPAPDSPNDPRASFFRKFVLNGEETGHSAYNELFSNIKTQLSTNQSEDWNEVNSKMQELAVVWEGHQPNATFYNN